MKKAFLYTAFAVVTAGSMFTACDSKEEKVEEAKTDVADAKEELKEEKAELNAEYPAFKTEAEVKIIANEKRIAELTVIINKPGKLPLDEARKAKIKQLEEQNAQLRSRLYGYETERSDWETFKREFNHDMEGLGNALEDLGKTNK